MMRLLLFGMVVVAGAAVLAACGSGSSVPTASPVKLSRDGLLSPNRSAVGTCVDTIDVSQTASQFLRLKILDAVPLFRQDRFWDDTFPNAQDIPVTVQLGCPELAQYGYAVNVPSENLLFIYVTPLDQVQEYGRLGYQETVCLGDTCQGATDWLLLTPEDICDNERLIEILVVSLERNYDADVLRVPTYTPFFEAPPRFGLTSSPTPTAVPPCF